MKKACLFIFGFATLFIFCHFGNIHLLQFRHYYSHPLCSHTIENLAYNNLFCGVHLSPQRTGPHKYTSALVYIKITLSLS